MEAVTKPFVMREVVAKVKGWWRGVGQDAGRCHPCAHRLIGRTLPLRSISPSPYAYPSVAAAFRPKKSSSALTRNLADTYAP
jgi:hypothetical protein